MTATYPLHLQALRHSLVLLAETLVDGWPRDLRQPRSGATAEESRRAQTWATQMQAERGRLLQALLQAFRARRLAPMFIEGAFDADAVTRHFLA